MKTKTAIRSMRPEDIDQIYEIETASFTSPWTKDSFYHELLENPYAHYLVIEKDGCLAGYCGIWIIIDDAQITNIAIKPEYRGQSLGEALFRSAIELCREKKARRLSLEVRVSNHPAQSLYKKFGLQAGGIRKQYYTDNGEDALLMWVTLNE
ncbi:ribosomal protein S18-alanine N-acetyltransferase [Bacillus velezensis]|uniref:ribosomal protein S18-alanine N-acetyltransferase n=1 Tax=Bacillus velezensis TaxID=492670 RepID=UPI00336A293F